MLKRVLPNSLRNSSSTVCERTFSGHTDAILCGDVNPDGKYFVSGSADNTIRMWDIATGECLNVVRKHSRWVKTIKFSHGMWVSNLIAIRMLIACIISPQTAYSWLQVA
jgi:WD40 repeat protein